MGNYKEDTNRNVGTIFFIIIFSLFVLVFSDKPENRASGLSGSSLQNELVFENISIHHDAIVSNVVSLPEPYEICVSALQNTDLNLFSFQYQISGYNTRTTQEFINIQKARFTIEPQFLRRSYYPLSSGAKEDLPVLS